MSECNGKPNKLVSKVSSPLARALMLNTLDRLADDDEDNALKRFVKRDRAANKRAGGNVYQVAQAIWNAIADTQQLSTATFEALMAMSDQQIDMALEEQAQLLEACGVPGSVINAYQQIAPLLAENAAISNYINETGRTDLRGAMPEVINAREAVIIAASDRILTQDEQEKLLAMLSLLEAS